MNIIQQNGVLDKKYPYYVNTTDKVFSRIQQRTEYLCYACSSIEEARRVEAWVKSDRSDLIRVAINDKPRTRTGARTCIYLSPRFL